MTSFERVSNAYAFHPVDQLPLEYHPSERGMFEHKSKLRELFLSLPGDFMDFDYPNVPEPTDFDADGAYHAFTKDQWGTVWEERIYKMMGHPSQRPLDNMSLLPQYSLPSAQFADDKEPLTRERVQKMRQANKFVKLGGCSIFERLIALRRFEDVLVDLAEDTDEINILADRLMAYYQRDIAAMIEAKVDAISFGDDFGTQESTIISPAVFRRFFKPRYRAMMEPIKKAGIKVHFHSCGLIWNLLDDFKDMGVDSIWPQLPVYDIDKLAAKLKELQMAIALHTDRAVVMTKGTPQDVRDTFASYMRAFNPMQGGAWVYVEVDNNFPFENIEALIGEIAKWRQI
jgi:hypothetical protein